MQAVEVLVPNQVDRTHPASPQETLDDVSVNQAAWLKLHPPSLHCARHHRGLPSPVQHIQPIGSGLISGVEWHDCSHEHEKIPS